MSSSYHIYNTRTDNLFPDAYRTEYHVHILVHAGEMNFATKRKSFVAHANDLVIWQMTTPMLNITYSPDFDADFLCLVLDLLDKRVVRDISKILIVFLADVHAVLPSVRVTDDDCRCILGYCQIDCTSRIEVHNVNNLVVPFCPHLVGILV